MALYSLFSYPLWMLIGIKGPSGGVAAGTGEPVSVCAETPFSMVDKKKSAVRATETAKSVWKLLIIEMA